MGEMSQAEVLRLLETRYDYYSARACLRAATERLGLAEHEPLGPEQARRLGEALGQRGHRTEPACRALALVAASVAGAPSRPRPVSTTRGARRPSRKKPSARAPRPGAVAGAVVGLVGLSLLLGACGSTLIHGQVVDARKKPLRAVTIETEPPTDYVVTNLQGGFLIERTLDAQSTPQPLDGGKYTLIVRKLGYIDQRIPIVLEPGDELSVGSIVLARKRLELGDMEDVEANKGSGALGMELAPPIRGE